LKLKEKNKVWYCEDCCKEISNDDYPYHNANHTIIKRLRGWLFMSDISIIGSSIFICVLSYLCYKSSKKMVD
jgi:hypothetical protein